MGRAPCCDKANVKKGPWAPEEDAKLKAYIEQFGTGANWIALPQKIGLKRCGKSCRLRWLNYLRPNLKHGGFSEEEDNIICSLFISIGSRWSIIAAQLPGRTDNDIKNYWNTKLKKKLLGKHKQSRINRLSGFGQDSQDSSGVESLSNSAIERLQLHMQLQGLQAPYSFYTNLGLWPKLNPLQEKMVQQSLHLLNNGSNDVSDSLIQSPQTEEGQRVELYQPYENSMNEMPSSGSSILFKSEIDIPESSIIQELYGTGNQTNLGFQPGLTFQDELDDFLAKNNQMTQFDCLKDMDGYENKEILWSDEFDTNSASSNSWDSNSFLHHDQSGVGCHDFVQGYSIQ